MARRDRHAAPEPIGRQAWLAPPIGVVVIVGLAAAAALAQSTEWVYIVASLVFSLCEGVVLAIVGYSWSRRGTATAVFAAAATAAVAAPLRWEVLILTRNGLTVPLQSDLVTDFAFSIAWGAIAGLAGATILRPKLAALMHDDRTRWRPPRPR